MRYLDLEENNKNSNYIKALQVDVKKTKLIEKIFVSSNNSRGRASTMQTYP